MQVTRGSSWPTFAIFLTSINKRDIESLILSFTLLSFAPGTYGCKIK